MGQIYNLKKSEVGLDTIIGLNLTQLYPRKPIFGLNDNIKVLHKLKLSKIKNIIITKRLLNYLIFIHPSLTCQKAVIIICVY